MNTVRRTDRQTDRQTDRYTCVKSVVYLAYIIFVVFTFFVGMHHEPWADEAQSWLIARDCSFYDILFTRCSYEGTPFLWFYILKFFILLGGSYKYLFVISWLFSCIGVYIFLFKSKFPTIIKILTPFTYYIFYQYCVVARNYSLVFPALCLIAVFYKKRFERPYLYCFLLAVLASICAYTFLISSILVCFFIIDFIRLYKGGFNIKKILIKNIPVIILGLYMLCTFFICNSRPDYFSRANNYGLFTLTFMFNLLLSFVKINFDTTSFTGLIVLLFVNFYFYYISVKTFCRTKMQIIYFVIVNFVTLCFINYMVNYIWHMGILFLLFIFCCWVLQIENDIKLPFKTNKVFYVVWVIFLSVQIVFSSKNSLCEIYYRYDAAKDVAQFLKDNDFDKGNIIGVGHRPVAIQPYFDKNIFSNMKTSYYTWSLKDLKEDNEKIKKTIDEIPVAIIDNVDLLYTEEFSQIRECFQTFDRYVIFESYMYARGMRFIIPSVYWVFIREKN